MQSAEQTSKLPTKQGRGLRGQLAAGATVSVGSASRILRLGGGSVVGGRIGLAVAPDLLRRLSRGRRVALVSATNGKTTTTRLLATAMGGADHVATSTAGANLPPGIAAALAAAPRDAPAVLEVDEAYLAAVADAVDPAVVVLLNLSRDQLDRVSEVRSLATRWRAAMARMQRGVVVANADDPLVAWAASAAPQVRWVAAGQLWRGDATGCPACGGRIDFDLPGGQWRCASCGLTRPQPDVIVEGSQVRWSDGRLLVLPSGLPGRCNLANAAMAAVAAEVLGVEPHQALEAMATVDAVEGRFARVIHQGVEARLLLAKNPAGWVELLDLLQGGGEPVVVGINARIADGRDPSWLWDVAFERLADRAVVATGDRARDLAVRLRYGGVAHRVEPDQLQALRVAGELRPDSQDNSSQDNSVVQYVGNYTAFQDLRRNLARSGGSRTPRSRGGRWRYRRRIAGADSAAEQRAAPAGSLASTPLSSTPLSSDQPAVEQGEPGRSDHRSPPSPAYRPARPGSPWSASGSALRLAVLFPDLLGTYGDAGNGTVLAARAAWRGLPAELVLVHADDAVPVDADIYLLGGGEDAPQVQATTLLLADGSLARAVARGATVLAVCAGFQMIGLSFPDGQGQPRPGLGLLDATTVKRTGRRAVGELLAQPHPGLIADGDGERTGSGGSLLADGSRRRDVDPISRARAMVVSGGALTGFENHSGATVLGAGVLPLAEVVTGTGNDGRGSEGVWQGRLVGTYLHGPVLARNPALADAVLTMATGIELGFLDDTEEEALRGERVAAATPTRRPRRWGR